jgi:hypothetical protein
MIMIETEMYIGGSPIRLRDEGACLIDKRSSMRQRRAYVVSLLYEEWRVFAAWIIRFMRNHMRPQAVLLGLRPALAIGGWPAQPTWPAISIPLL